MNPADPSASTPSAEPALTRQEKEKLLQSMYTLPSWIAIIRMFGYQTLPMEQARQAIKPIADEYGKEPVANACEVLVEIRAQEKEPTARLKPHIRRMAFQILGPEPQPNAVAPNSVPATPPKETPADPEPPRPHGKRKGKRPSEDAPPADNVAKTETGVPGDSPIMQQYRAAKEKHPGMVLLFRLGDFYELFGEDAETAHKLLGLTLTTRDRTLTMAGFPHHQLEAYLHKLLHEGQRVAICEPVEESLARGPIRREVTRFVTPRSVIEDESAARQDEGKPVRQPRVHVLKEYEAWLNKSGLAFVAVDDVRRTTPAIAAHVAGLDYIVLRGEEKLLVTVRPHLQAKHIAAIRELQTLFGAEYKPARVWPSEGPAGWNWHEHPVDASTAGSEPNAGAGKTKRSRSKQSA